MNKGRCPICTLLIPCKHYNNTDEVNVVKNTPSRTANKKWAGNELPISMLNYAVMVMFVADTSSKDYSSVQKYLNSARNKHIGYNRRRKIGM